MKKEAKLLGVDLKQRYVDKTALYNSTCLLGDVFSPVVSTPNLMRQSTLHRVHPCGLIPTLLLERTPLMLEPPRASP